MAIDTAKFQRSIAACIANGERLLEDADWAKHRASTDVALAMLAQEECAKAFVLALVRDGILPWTDDVRRSLSVHECKHTVTVIMEWLLEVNERRLHEIGERTPSPPRSSSTTSPVRSGSPEDTVHASGCAT